LAGREQGWPPRSRPDAAAGASAGRRPPRPAAAKFGELVARATLLGIVPGFVTDAIVTAAGA
jgi:UPF0716 family protein affecting phage T7 exclusion